MNSFLLMLLTAFVLSGCMFQSGGDEEQAVAPLSAPVSMPGTTPGTPEQQAEARASADAFLQQVEDGEYAATWEQSSPVMKGLVGSEGWATMLSEMRDGAGKLRGRKLDGVAFADTIKDAPPGEYVYVFYTSTYADMTIADRVVMQRVDGRWKIVGYFYNKRPNAGR